MNRPLSQTPSLPRVPPSPNGIVLSQGLREYLFKHATFANDFLRAVQRDLSDVHSVINTATQGVGEDLESESTITISAAIHRVSGTAAIDTIAGPENFSGPIFLIADGTWSLTTSGNITLALTATPGSTVILTYDYNTETWSPIAAGEITPFDPTHLQEEIDALDVRVTTLEASVTTLQEQVAEILAGDKVLYWEALVGARDSVNTDFTIAGGTILYGANGAPLASVFQGGTPIRYVSAAPVAYQWTMTGQTITLGTPPTGDPLDEPILQSAVIA